jgi:RNA polymerase sigma-70 factor, ECF subfamily
MPEHDTRMSEHDLLAAARGGDGDAFGRLVDPYRGELRAHCYRMLASVHDAEDAVQETLLRAWRGLARYEGRSSLRSWLYTIATNVCLRAIERRPKRVLPIDYGPDSADPHTEPAPPLSESVWIEPYPDERLEIADGLAGPAARYEQRESVELAFVAALQHLSAQQRAVLILRDVLGYSGAEAAEMLDTNADAVYSTLQRAHKAVEARLPEESQQTTLRSLGDERLREIVERYVGAWERRDVDGLAAMLAKDAVLAMPPVPTWFRGRDVVAAFLRGYPLGVGAPWRLVTTRANGQPAFGHYRWDEDTQAFVARTIALLTLADDRIVEITAFREPRLFSWFGLPDELAKYPFQHDLRAN